LNSSARFPSSRIPFNDGEKMGTVVFGFFGRARNRTEARKKGKLFLRRA